MTRQLVTRQLVASGVMAAACLMPRPLLAQDAESRVLPGMLGGVAGIAGGGYVAIALIVAESRYGRYVHDFDDVLGWRSLPVLIGGATGASLGVYSPRRFESALLYGTAGLGLGAALGLGLGAIAWDPPEGRWAGATIGAGLGLVIGNIVGIVAPRRGDNDDDGGDAAAIVIPFSIRTPF